MKIYLDPPKIDWNLIDRLTIETNQYYNQFRPKQQQKQTTPTIIQADKKPPVNDLIRLENARYNLDQSKIDSDYYAKEIEFIQNQLKQIEIDLEYNRLAQLVSNEKKNLAQKQKLLKQLHAAEKRFTRATYETEKAQIIIDRIGNNNK